MNRREFTKQLGRGFLLGCAGEASGSLPGALSAAEPAAQKPGSELMMLILCAHTLPASGAFSPETVRGWIRLCAELGVSTILWRGSYVGKVTYHSSVLPMMKRLETDYYTKQGFNREVWESTRVEFNRRAEQISSFDTLDVAVAEARKTGIRIYGHVGLFDMYFPGLENDFFDEHPQYWVLARDQKTSYRGIPCYAEKAAQDYRLAEIQELLDRGVDGISYDLESHDNDGGELGPDDFSFNPPVVEAFQERHGTNILKESFDPARLHRLNGEFFTGFLRRIREALGTKRRLAAATTVDGYCGYGGTGGAQVGARFVAGGPVKVTPSIRFDLEWRKWIEEGIADDLLVNAPIPNAVEQTQRAIKSRLESGRVLLWRETDEPERYENYGRELDAIRRGALDGYAIDELANYIPPDAQYRRLLIPRGR